MKKFGKNIDREKNNAYFSEYLNYQENDLFSCFSVDEKKENNKSVYKNSQSKKYLVNNDLHSNDDFFLVRTKSESLTSSVKNNPSQLSNITDQSENLKQFATDQPRTSQRKLIRLSELEERNLYNILNVEENSNQEKIKKSYKLLCVTNHPDKGGNPENFDKIHKAYKILTNDLTRIIYDKFSFRAMDLIEFILTNEDQTNKFSDLFKEESDMELLRVLIMCKN
jgi:hypothetical protein